MSALQLARDLTHALHVEARNAWHRVLEAVDEQVTSWANETGDDE